MNIRYPNITGLSEKEQLQQIKSYLWQLVDQLNFGTNTASEAAQSGENKGGNAEYHELRSFVLTGLDDLEQRIGAETGTSEGWTYKKWRDGTYEMLGEFSVTATAAGVPSGIFFTADDGATFGGDFRSETFSLPIPFAVTSAIVSGSAGTDFIVTGDLASNKINFVLLRQKAFNAGMKITVRLHVAGTYNQGGTD